MTWVDEQISPITSPDKSGAGFIDTYTGGYEGYRGVLKALVAFA